MKIPHAVLLIACGLLLSLRSAQGADMVAIAGDEINMRSGPGSDQPVLWKLGAGFPLEVVSSKGEWQQVKDFEGSTGWVHKKTTQKTPYVIVRANKDSDQQINVRREPKTSAEVVAKATTGWCSRSWVPREPGSMLSMPRACVVGWKAACSGGVEPAAVRFGALARSLSSSSYSFYPISTAFGRRVARIWEYVRRNPSDTDDSRQEADPASFRTGRCHL